MNTSTRSSFYFWFSSLYHYKYLRYKFGLFFKTSSPHQPLSQNFKILRERFYKWIFHLSFDFHLSINIGTWNTNLDLFNPFLGWWRHHVGSKFQNSEIVLSNTKTSTQFFLYYWISSSYHHWYIKYKSGPFLIQFWVKTVILWESDLWNKILTSVFHQIMISIFLYSFGLFLPNLEIMTSQKK